MQLTQFYMQWVSKHNKNWSRFLLLSINGEWTLQLKNYQYFIFKLYGIKVNTNNDLTTLG